MSAQSSPSATSWLVAWIEAWCGRQRDRGLDQSIRAKSPLLGSHLFGFEAVGPSRFPQPSIGSQKNAALGTRLYRMNIRLTIDKAGRVVIPKPVREQLRFRH